jgi:hypothetical protein
MHFPLDHLHAKGVPRREEKMTSYRSTYVFNSAAVLAILMVCDVLVLRNFYAGESEPLTG